MKRFYISAILLLSILFSTLLSVQASALKPCHNPSDEYLAGPYGANLSSLTLTGDERTDLILVALSQLGYHEGNSDADMGGLNSAGSKNFAEFNRLYGKLDNGEGNGYSYGYYWCCAFATWCARQAGIDMETVPTEVSCRRLILENFQPMGIYHTASEDYTPRSGDYIFFLNTNTSSAYVSNHVGIVLYVYNGRVYTIEGNSKNENVSVMNYDLNDPYIVGFASPKYKETPEAAIDFNPYHAGFKSDAKYYITVSELNVREESNAESKSIGILYRGDVVKVSEVENNWGKISLGKMSGWISLKYAQYSPCLKNSIIYDTQGGELIPATPIGDDGKAHITSNVSQKANSTLLGWSLTKENADSKKVDYYIGQEVSFEETTTLFAVWETAPIYTLTFNANDALHLIINVAADGNTITLPSPPKKESDKPLEYCWISSGWDADGDGNADYASGAQLSPKENMTLVAVYESVPVTYTITFVGLDGNDIKTDYLEYGAIPTPPIKIESYFTPDGKYEHRFDGWETEIGEVRENFVYKPKYISIEIISADLQITEAPPSTTPANTLENLDDTNENVVNDVVTKIIIVAVIAIILIGTVVFVIVWKRTAKKS